MFKKLAIAGTLALATVTGITPAFAHGGGFWPGFAVGALTGFLAPRPYYGYGYGYAPPVVFAPPPVYYYPPGAPTVVVPSVQPDPAIRFAQHALNYLGYGPLNEDGIEGPETYNAICAFQVRNSLVVDGIAGSAFFAVINAQLPPPPPPAATKEPAPNTDGKKG